MRLSAFGVRAGGTASHHRTITTRKDRDVIQLEGEDVDVDTESGRAKSCDVVDAGAGLACAARSH